MGNDQRLLHDEHTPRAVATRLAGGPDRSHLRDLVYGAIDGTVTTFAVVAGVAGAELGAVIVLVLGVANLVADGFSMAVSNYLGTRSEEQRRDRVRREEERHVALVPEGEREEVRQLLEGWDLDDDLREQVVARITDERDRWVDVMLQLEHGFPAEPARPLAAAIATFTAFVVVGAVPLLPFVAAEAGVSVASPFLWSGALTLGAFVLVGIARGVAVDLPAGGRPSRRWPWAVRPRRSPTAPACCSRRWSDRRFPRSDPGSCGRRPDPVVCHARFTSGRARHRPSGTPRR